MTFYTLVFASLGASVGNTFDAVTTVDNAPLTNDVSGAGRRIPFHFFHKDNITLLKLAQLNNPDV